MGAGELRLGEAFGFGVLEGDAEDEVHGFLAVLEDGVGQGGAEFGVGVFQQLVLGSVLHPLGDEGGAMAGVQVVTGLAMGAVAPGVVFLELGFLFAEVEFVGVGDAAAGIARRPAMRGLTRNSKASKMTRT